MIRRAGFVVLLLLAFAFSVARASNPTPLADYRRAVSQALTLVERARTEPNLAQRQSLLAQAAAQLKPIQTVQAESGEQWEIDNSKLIDNLTSAASGLPTADRLDNIAARLRALGAALIAPPVAVSKSDRAKLHDLLNRPPFQTNDTSNPLKELVNRFLDWLSRLFGNTQGIAFDLRDAISAIGFVFVIVVLIFFMRMLLSNLVSETQLKQAPQDVDLDSGAALVQAQRLAKQGDYRTAVRQLYLATLLLLDERGLLRYDRTLTNREYLHLVQNDLRVRSALEPIVDTFDRTWYGLESVAPEEFEKYRRQVETLKGL